MVCPLLHLFLRCFRCSPTFPLSRPSRDLRFQVSSSFVSTRRARAGTPRGTRVVVSAPRLFGPSRKSSSSRDTPVCTSSPGLFFFPGTVFTGESFAFDLCEVWSVLPSGRSGRTKDSRESPGRDWRYGRSSAISRRRGPTLLRSVSEVFFTDGNLLLFCGYYSGGLRF